MPLIRNEHARWINCLLIAIAVALSLYLTIYVWRRVARPPVPGNDPRGDFPYFYAAAQAMTHGEDIYASQAPGMDRRGYIYPPLIAFLYQPLGRFDLVTAARISLLVNVAAAAAAVIFATKALLERLRSPPTDLGNRARLPVALAIAVFAVLLTTDKLKGELQMLQTNTLVACAMALGLWLLDRRPFWAGAALGFALNIKYQAVALLMYLVFRKRWKPAGATILWTLIWAFLPALSVGVRQDANYLAQGFSGLLKMAGMKVADNAANIETVSNGLSISITSALARFLERSHIPASPFLVAGIIALIWLAALALLYRSRRLPVLAWPRESAQRSPPYPALVGIEWIAVIASVLAFSPQTNTRHLFLTVMVNILALVVLLESRGNYRLLPLAGIILLWMGLNLPPGNRTNPSANHAAALWQNAAGPTITLLIATALITAAGLVVAKRTAPT